MQATTVREALRASLAGTFGTILSVLPRLVVFAIALAVGWAVSSLLARATIAALRAVRFDEMAQRSGLARFIQQMGVQQDPTGAVAGVAKWVVRLMTLVVALDVLGLPAGWGVLHQLLLWLPNLAVGLVALVIGGLAARALSRLAQGFATAAGLPNPQVLATATSVAVWAFAVVVAVSQLGIATSVVNLGLVGVVGAIALAVGLAFGWAGRDRAAQLLSLLDEHYASRSGAVGSASPSAATSGTAPAASDTAASPVAASGIPAASPVAATSVSASAPATDHFTRVASPDTAASGSVPDQPDLASAPVLDLPTPGLDLSAPVLDASTPVLDLSTPTLERSAANLEMAPELEGMAPELEGMAPELEGMAPELEGMASEYEETVSEYGGTESEYERTASEYEAEALAFEERAPGFEGFVPAEAEPEFESAAPELEASAPMLDKSGPELALFPEDEPALARLVPFEESWIPRSGVDRRRIARPGPDRRASTA